MKVFVEKAGFAPTRAYSTDAGMDLRSPCYETIHPHSSVIIDTLTHVQLPKKTCGLLVSKSGLNVVFGITSTGLVDESYTGSIKVKLYNNSNMAYEVKPGDKITQLVVLPIKVEEIELVDSLEEGERGSNGFGSSGR